MRGQTREEVARRVSVFGRRSRRLAADLDALAVRRVDHQRAGQIGGQLRRGPLERVAAVERDGRLDAGTLRVAAREVDHPERHVAGVDRHGARMNARLGVAAQALKFGAHRVACERQQALEREAPLQAGRDAAGDLRGFDRDRAGAAARVVQRTAGLGGAAPAGGGEHRGGERFFQRRVTLVFAPAALEQRFAGAVDVQRGLVLAQVQHDVQVGVAGVDARALAGGVAQQVAHGILHAQRGEIQAPERAAVRGRVHAQGVPRCDPLGPLDAARELVHIVLVAIGTVRDLDQHALREPALEVQRHHVERVAFERDAAARFMHARLRQRALHFLGEERLDAGGAGEK